MKNQSVVNKLSVIALLLAVIVIAAANIRAELGRLSELSVSTDRVMGEDGTLFDIRDDKNGTDWLRRISPNGALLAHIPFKEPAGSVCVRRSVIGAAEGLVYIHELMYDSAGYIPISEAVRAYDMKTGESRELFADIPPVEDGIDSRYAPRGIWDGGILLARQSGGTDGIPVFVEVIRADALTGEMSLLYRADMPFSVSCLLALPEGIVIASPDSVIRLFDGDKWHILFRPEGREALTDVFAGGDGGVYAFVSGPDGGRLLKKEPDSQRFREVRALFYDTLSVTAYSDDIHASLHRSPDSQALYFQITALGENDSFSSLSVPFRLVPSAALIIRVLTELLLASSVILLIRHVCLRKRMRLIVKQAVVSIPVFAMGTFLLYDVIAEQVSGELHRKACDQLLVQAAWIADSIDTAGFVSADWDNPFEDAYYRSLREQLEASSSQRYISWEEDGAPEESGTTRAYTSFWVFRLEEGTPYIAFCDSFFVNMEARYLDRDQRYRLVEPVSGGGGPAIGRTYGSDGQGYWLNVLYPILHEGETIGFVEAGKPALPIDSAVEGIMDGIFMLMAFILGTLLLTYIAVLGFFLRALGRMERGARQIAHGDYSARLPVTSTDETADIARAFNSMAGSVEESDKSIRAVRDGYSRFVPGEMLDILGKESVTGIGPGDYARLRAVYLLLGTESFDAYKDKELFDALNRFYSCTIPYISRAGGVIEHYGGRGMTAIFDATTETALNALIDMYAAHDRLYSGQTVRCQALLSGSDSLLGVVGDGGRLNMIAISRFAYEAERVRKMCGRYGCRVILDANAYDGMGTAVSAYRSRLLGYISHSGTQIPAYDFYDAEPPQLMRNKDETREAFQEAVKQYYSGNYPAARGLFIQIIKRSPRDMAAREYLKESHDRMESGLPPGFLLEI